MLNSVHFQILHMSYGISSRLKCTHGFHSSEVIQKCLLKQRKKPSRVKWLSNSPYMRLNFTNDPIYITNRNSNDFMFKLLIHRDQNGISHME